MINKDVLIIGAGPAGMSAALYLARSKYSFEIVEKNMIGGKLNITTRIDNYPGVPSTDGFTLADTMKKQLESFNIKVKFDEVIDISKEKDGFYKVFTKNDQYLVKAIIVATGTETKKIGISNEDKLVGKGISYCAVCDAFFFRGKNVLVFANERKGYLESLYLSQVVGKVYLVSDKDQDDLENNLSKLKSLENVEFISPYKITKFNGEDYLTSVEIENIETKETKTIDVDGCFPLIGEVPPTYFLNKLSLVKNRDRIVVDEKCLSKGDNPGIFAAGDIIDKNLNQVVTACNDGAIAATSTIKYLNSLK